MLGVLITVKSQKTCIANSQEHLVEVYPAWEVRTRIPMESRHVDASSRNNPDTSRTSSLFHQLIFQEESSRLSLGSRMM